MLTNGAMDFKSIVYAIPPLAHWRCGWELHPRITVLSRLRICNIKAAIGIEPMNNGFADRSLNHLGTPPYCLRDPAKGGADRPLSYLGTAPLERAMGFEPTTSTLARLRSTN